MGSLEEQVIGCGVLAQQHRDGMGQQRRDAEMDAARRAIIDATLERAAQEVEKEREKWAGFSMPDEVEEAVASAAAAIRALRRTSVCILT